MVRGGKRRSPGFHTLLGRGVTKAGWCRRRGGPGDWTAARSRGTSCNADKTGRTLEELIRSRSSSTTSNLIGRDTLAGGSAAVAGVRLSGSVGGVRDAIAFSSVKRHTSIHVANTSCNELPSIRRRCMACIRLSLSLR